MQLVMNLVLLVQLLAAIVMIGLVLVQQGKGADMGASFGGGASGSLFGATGSANFLSRTTAVCATIFFVSTLTLSYFSNVKTVHAGGSVLDRAAVSASAPAPAPVASAAAQIPTADVPAASAAASR